MPTISFDYTVVVPVPPERVFAAMTDTEEMGRWMPGFVRIERLTEGDFGVGTTFRETRKMFGMDSTEYFEVRAFEPPHRIDFYIDGKKGTSKSGEFQFSYRLQPAEGGAQLQMVGEIGGMSGFAALIGRFMVGSFKKMCAKDMDALKDYLAKG
ncbi:MAG: SRPBCC family protein [Candidatus Sericytochromatia bacterium]|uniref:SRPBCC family protein n=1 Tax=Candidatus Tanganyikabacteria bacterium TaxID=2961651 RepID=A0A937X1S6_9BACT|nr:SRPBCC family protein [Candidatus Tanganyikabacteria bacterium]